MRTRAAAGASLVGLMALSGCGFGNLNSMALPGDKGVGENSYVVHVQLRNALNIVPNSPVQLNDVVVGTIRSIDLNGYRPVATISLEDSVKLPENVSARIAQTSLLGAKHIDLIAPPSGQGVGRLHDGSTIPVARTGAYPETEDVIASAATLLNGGGLQQIRTITTELNRALGGRTATVRQLLPRATRFAAEMDQQKTSIVHALNSMNTLAAGFRANTGTINRALDSFPPALKVLNADRAKLIATLESLGQFGGTVHTFVDTGGRPLVRNIAALAPVMRELADAKKSLTSSLWIVPTVAFPLRTMGEYIRGDYINLWGTVDVGLDTLDRGLLSGTPLAGALLDPLGFLKGVPGLVTVPGPASGAPEVTIPGLSPATSPSQLPSLQPQQSQSATPGGGATAPKSSNPLGSLLTNLLGGGKR